MKHLFLLFLTTTLFSKHIHYEKWYQNIAADKFNGKKEAILDNKTRVDILTDSYAIEVDFSHKCYESVGQSLYYAYKTKKNPGIILIVENEKLDMRYIQICKYLAKKENIRLWIMKANKLILINKEYR